MSSEFFHRQGVFKRVRSVIIRPSQSPSSSVSRGILTRSLSARGDAEKRRRTILRRQNAIDDDDQE
ncbi:Protein CBG12619 [Caenorhabditis briggsae]|uniref:Protein CBG12619 n=1 Tax=Caenorhabditis briggsae TaxID=6238 RepID=A8XG61_CAEBR|nr:Protein CBG12619 [Caenorhabditis briggsae]CAP31567.1 Protein CBG12619 [Caenorhabditis briggsae]